MAEPSPHWYDADWDKLTLGSTQMPGLWSVEGGAERRIDVKPRKGEDGAAIKDQGYENAKLTLVGRMIEKEDFKALQGALKEVHPRRKGAARDPLALLHPAATVIGVDAVYVVAIEAPTLVNSVLEIRIQVIEWIEAPKPVPKKKQFLNTHTASSLGAGLGDARRSLQGSVYTGDYGFDVTDRGYVSPSEGIAELEISGG